MFVTKRRLMLALNSYQQLQATHECLSERFDIIKKDQNKQMHEIAQYKVCIDQLESELKESRQRIDDLMVQLSETQEQLTVAERSVYADENTVRLAISDDLQSIVPTIKVKEAIFEKMVEQNMLTDAVTPDTKSIAMQVALMVVARDALEQAIDQFSGRVD